MYARLCGEWSWTEIDSLTERDWYTTLEDALLAAGASLPLRQTSRISDGETAYWLGPITMSDGTLGYLIER